MRLNSESDITTSIGVERIDVMASSHVAAANSTSESGGHVMNSEESPAPAHVVGWEAERGDKLRTNRRYRRRNRLRLRVGSKSVYLRVRGAI